MTRIVTAATVAAILLASAVAYYSISLLLIGMPGMSVEEFPEGTPFSEARGNRVYHPTPHAIIPLSAAATLIGGLLSRKLWLAWAGFGLLLFYSAVFLFSTGAGLLPVDGLLLILLTIIQVSGRK